MAMQYGSYALHGRDAYEKVQKELMTKEEALNAIPKLWRKKATEHYEYLVSKEVN